MNEEEKVIDQSELAKTVSDKIKYDFFDTFLVKPLDPVKVTKEFSKPVSDSKAKKDKNGIKAVDYDKVETEVKEVDSDYRKGVIIKRPLFYETNNPMLGTASEIKLGDVVIFKDTSGIPFDLLKDSRLLRQYDIVGIEK